MSRSRHASARRFLARVSTLVVLLAGAVVGAPSQSTLRPASADTVNPYADFVAPAAALATSALSAGLGTAAPVTIAVISTGVTRSALPEPVRGRVPTLSSYHEVDTIGYGTMVTSQLLQLAPHSQVTTLSAFPAGQFNADWLKGDLQWVADRASSFDAVVLAFPPEAYLDPISELMARGMWDELDDVLAAHPLADASGPVFGAALDWNLYQAQRRGLPSRALAVLDTWVSANYRWLGALANLDRLSAAGVPVVAAAGDRGILPQQVVGLAGVPQVITVGAADGTTVAATSSTGPSFTGAVKPDLVAPTGVVGLLPAGSALARALDSTGRLDSALVPALQGDVPSTTARTRLATSVTGAAVVGAAVAGLHDGGITDLRTVRAALAAAADPDPAVSVGQQGAGVLRFAPDLEFARSASGVAGPLNLGTEPASGTWSALVPVVGSSAGVPTVRLTEFLGVGPDGRNVQRSLTADQAYPVTASAGTDGVRVTAPLGEESYEGGLYCGYTQVPLNGTSSSADARLRAEGLPVGVEQVPTCLVNGSRMVAHAIYIHDIGADHETFALHPAAPLVGGVLDRAMHVLPLNPVDLVAVHAVTDEHGDAVFPNVVPGFYKIKLHADYGAPVRRSATDVLSGGLLHALADVGAPLGYQSVTALLLSRVCTDPGGELSTAYEDSAGSACTKDFLEQRFGAENVQPDKGMFVVRPGGVAAAEFRVAFGGFKRLVGTNVVGRVVDQLAVRDMEPIGADLATLTGRRELKVLPGAAWRYDATSGSSSDEFTASFNPAYFGANATAQLGILRYPFNLPTPNYTAGFDLNFRHRLGNVAMLAIVQIGSEVAVGTVIPGGAQVTLPTVGTEQPVDPSTLRLDGSSGAARFHFEFLPRGTRTGTLYLAFVPYLNTGQTPALTLPKATVSDLSFELNTWVNSDWPATLTSHGQGHAFRIDPNYSARQMSAPACRSVASNTTKSGGIRATVCEDWQMLVHSALDRAATVDVRNAGGGSLLGAMQSAGATYANPHRGFNGGVFDLAYLDRTVGAARTRLSVQQALVTNGTFWEQLSIPKSAISANPGPLLVEVLDVAPGRQSPLFAHADGPLELPPYVPFNPLG